MVVCCNNAQCRYCENQRCICDKVYYIDRLCVTFRRHPHKENYRELMKASFSSNCRHKDNKYKSSVINLIK